MIRLVTGGRYTGQFIIQTDNFVENETFRRGETLCNNSLDLMKLTFRACRTCSVVHSNTRIQSSLQLQFKEKLFCWQSLTLEEDDVKTSGG